MRKDPEPVRGWTWPHYRFASHLLFPAVFTLAGGWRVTGREYVPRTGGALIAANHISHLDPPAIAPAPPSASAAPTISPSKSCS